MNFFFRCVHMTSMLTFLGDNQEQTDKISQASQALCCFKYVTVDSAWINLYTIIGDSTNQSQFLGDRKNGIMMNRKRFLLKLVFFLAGSGFPSIVFERCGTTLQSVASVEYPADREITNSQRS